MNFVEKKKMKAKKLTMYVQKASDRGFHMPCESGTSGSQKFLEVH